MPSLRCQPLPGLHRMGEPGTTIDGALERVPPIIENEAILTAVAVGAACLLILYFALAKRVDGRVLLPVLLPATRAVTSRKRTPSRSPSRSPGRDGSLARSPSPARPVEVAGDEDLVRLPRVCGEIATGRPAEIVPSFFFQLPPSRAVNGRGESHSCLQDLARGPALLHRPAQAVLLRSSPPPIILLPA